MGLWTLARSVGTAVISALFPIPKIALLPLMILWFGIGEPSKVMIIALGVFFPTTIAAYSGVDGVPRNLVRMAQSFGVPFPEIVRQVVLPGASGRQSDADGSAPRRRGCPILVRPRDRPRHRARREDRSALALNGILSLSETDR